MTPLQLSSTVTIMTCMMLAALAQASYVDLFKDADYKNKLSRIEDIDIDQCYSIACEKLDNTITSAKWSGLPEKTSKGDDVMISFYTERDCQGHDIWWRVKTQSDDDLYFPSNFRLDGLNDDISSFMVWKKKKILGEWVICTTEGTRLYVGNKDSSASGSSATANDTVAYL